MLSVVIPILDEEDALPVFLECVDAWGEGHEVVFCDGGSTDGTLDLLAGRLVVEGFHGRGAQCQAGVARCQGTGIVFLHADTLIEPDALLSISKALDGGASWGCLTLSFNRDAWKYRWGAAMSNARVRLTGIPFGDQCMFMTRKALANVGGVPPLPIMEDYELSRRLRRCNGWPLRLPDKACTSARRFESGNPYLAALRMRSLRSMYRRGVSVERLAELYQSMGDGGRHAID